MCNGNIKMARLTPLLSESFYWNMSYLRMKLGLIYFVTPGPAQSLQHSSQSRLAELCSRERRNK